MTTIAHADYCLSFPMESGFDGMANVEYHGSLKIPNSIPQILWSFYALEEIARRYEREPKRLTLIVRAIDSVAALG